MADTFSTITDLPLDILVLIFPYLDAKSFLNFCAICKGFQQPSIRLDPIYWRHATRSAFRIPNQPVVQNDGLRWQKMFRRLFTQSRVYTWGKNGHCRLGHSYGQEITPRFSRMRPRVDDHTSFPTEMEDTRNLGVIADMQCGGWSTTLLTAKGTLHTAGVLNGLLTVGVRDHLSKLQFPTGSLTDGSENPSTAVRQFSAGRTHILALSDNGCLWSWYHAKRPALQVKFAHLYTKGTYSSSSSSSTSAYGQIKQVLAGWGQSSALIQGVGIVIWKVVVRGENHDDRATDTTLVGEHIEVPKTGYQRIKYRQESEDDKALGEEVGMVLNYILLENFIVFVTDIGKVFCGKFGEHNVVTEVLELQQLRNSGESLVDVQGSFRRFAVFQNNEVITTSQDYLEECWKTRHMNMEYALSGQTGLHRIPALQHSDVISVAFGDYHYIALHSSGRITSYGTEMEACGALGLGGLANNIGRARGIVYAPLSRNGQLLRHTFLRGREVWFDERKKQWINHIMTRDEDESKDRFSRFLNVPDVQGEYSEWFEQESKALSNDDGEDGLGAYFALRISAAGWHTGALVLVNEELANKPSSYNWEGKGFPRLILSDGTEMAGKKGFDQWRDGNQWQLDDAPSQ